MLDVLMSRVFQIGDRELALINGEPAMLWWRDNDHLVIDDADVRRIVYHHRNEDGSQTFVCTDADGTLAVNAVEEIVEEPWIDPKKPK